MENTPTNELTLLDCYNELNTLIFRIDFLTGVFCNQDSLELGENALSGLFYILHGVSTDLEKINKAIENHR